MLARYRASFRRAPSTSEGWGDGDLAVPSRRATAWRSGPRLAGVALAAIVCASYALLAVAHADDRYRLDPVAGNWLALTDYATRGVLFPPVHEDGYYGGTRYMPLPVLADAAAARLTGDLLLGSKLVTYIVAVAVFALAFAVLRRVGCPRVLAALVLASVVVTPVGLSGTLGIRNDGPALALQLGALALVLRAPTRLSLATAGVACGLALLSKISGLWAVAAVVLWLLLGDRRDRIVPFLIAFACSVAVVGATLELLTDGRFSSQVGEFTFAGRSGPPVPLVDGVQALVTDFAVYADAVWLLFPFAVVALASGVRARRPTLLQLALLADVAIVSVIMSSPETSENHLLELCVLTALVAGELVGRAAAARRDILPLVVALAAAWGVASSYQRTMGPETVGAIREVRHPAAANPAYERNPLEGFVTTSDRVLSQDPSIPLELGQRPILTDGFITRHAAADDPRLLAELVRRIARREFDKIITVAALAPHAPDLYELQFLGRTVNDAVLANYRLQYVERDIYVYVPTAAA